MVGERLLQRREELIKRFPDSPLAKKAIYQIGRNYQAIAYYESVMPEGSGVGVGVGVGASGARAAGS